MRYYLSLLFLLLLVLPSRGTTHKSSSVLATGKWYKIAITQTGIHKITYDDFVAMGFNLTLTGDSTIRIFGNGGGMLPEANNGRRNDDLREIPVQVVDQGDGKLDQGDYVLFYGEAPDTWTYDYKTTHTFSHNRNLYADSTFYYINADQVTGKRVALQAPPDTLPNIFSKSFDEHVFHDLDQRNLIKSGKIWYGEAFDNSVKSYDFSFDFPYIDPLSHLRVVTNVAARASVVSKFILSNNTRLSDTIYVDYTDPQNLQSYAQTKQKVTTLSNPASSINLNLTYDLPVSNALGWLNFIELTCRRNIHWNSPQMQFRDATTIEHYNTTEFSMSDAGTNVTIWNVTDPGNIVKLSGTMINDTLKFIIKTDTLVEFAAFDGSSFFPVHLSGNIDNQNLHGLTPSTLVIVTNPLFTFQANRLADFHRGKGKISVDVVTTTQVYNEFSSGIKDLTAIRDLMKMLYDRGYPDNSPKYLLLFGDGSYDPKNRIPGNNNMVPTYESLESLNIVQSYVTEDYFGIMGDNEGLYSNGSIEIGIGRFPVSDTAQAKAVVDKIIHYSSRSDTILSDWRNTMTFVADDENSNLHMQQAEQLTEIVLSKYPAFNVRKIYLDAYPLVKTPAGERFPQVNGEIDKAVADGSLIINYTGHGGEDGWSGEKVLTVGDIESWTNKDKLPVFITATCEFSRFDNPERFSAGEMVIDHPDGGAIALYSTTRQAMATSNFKLDTSFFNHLLPPDGQPLLTMGDLLRISKNNNENNYNIRNFVLLGDPAQEIAFPRYRVVTTEINNKPAGSTPDTTYGLTILNVKGEIRNIQGSKIDTFNGTLYSRILDKPVTYKTLGNKPGVNGSYPQTFKVQNSLIGYEKTSVKNGGFEFSCVIPRDIGLQFGQGKISYYCQDGTTDANGYTDEIVVGGCDTSINMLNKGPDIHLYMDNTGFISGGRTESNTVFLAFLSDTNGINSTGLGIGHEITAILDNNSTNPIVLNDYFSIDTDTYEKGSVSYPLTGLSTGLHKITLKAWDLYNNSSQGEILFFVLNQPVLSMNQVINFPNPFSSFTTFQFNPLQNAGTLKMIIEIISINGQKMKTIESTVSDYGSVPVFVHWDGRGDNGNKLQNGIYLYKLILKGANGTFTQASQKLMILN
ncbi:MAG: type IX secretion system sortase PorU [Bacteroidetes bacterium]|nr:type IX secretion system sortase PorU [Bacteroidota bacterium]